METTASSVEHSGAAQPVSSCASGQEMDHSGLVGCADVGSPPSITLSYWRGRTGEAEQQMVGLSTAEATQTGWRILVSSVELLVGTGPTQARQDDGTADSPVRLLAGNSCGHMVMRESNDSHALEDGTGSIQPIEEGHVDCTDWQDSDRMQISRDDATDRTDELEDCMQENSEIMAQMEGPSCDVFLVSLSQTDAITPMASARPDEQWPVDSGAPQSDEVQPQWTPEEKLQDFCMQVARVISPLITRRPETAAPTKQRRPRKRQQLINTTPRRSVRIAKGLGRGSAASKQHQAIMRKLCLTHEGEFIGDAALQAFVGLFSNPLSDTHIAAILALFGWEPSVLPLQELPVGVATER